MTGKFSTQINWAENFLNELNLLEERILYPTTPDDPLSIYRSLNYEKTWRYCVENQVYVLQLNDASIIQINYSDNDHYSFSYYECPYDAGSYREFLANVVGTTFHDVGDTFQDEYDLYLSQSSLKESPMMIRYDYDPASYNQGLHPSSHLHFGYNSNVRLGICAKLDPQAFILLVIRQCYPSLWRQVIATNTAIINAKVLSAYIGALDQIDIAHLQAFDKYEFYLH